MNKNKRLPNDCFALPRGITWTPVDQAIRQLKKKGFIIKKSPVTMAKILTRVNKKIKCEVFKNLPTSSINMHEWWVSK